MAVVWENPPGRVTKHGWAGIAEKLRANPGVWAKVPTVSGGQAGTYCAHVKNARLRAFAPAGSFEAVTRNKTMYVRYVGESGSDVISAD